ncbi:MAG: hypothetical protein O3B65_06410 [Chloroflexi bacterium]|nr:hypothetical protein [Chloroflexota bacterium]
MDLFTIGKMPLGAAWAVGWVLSIGSTYMVVSLAAGSSFDKPIFLLWLLLPTGLTPIVASMKGRRLPFWALTSIALFLVGILQPYFQPMMALAAVTLGNKPPVKIHEPELEADESARAMRSISYIGRDVAVIQVAMAEEYVRRDIAKLRARVPELEKVELKIAAVPPQKSERGHRARMHLTAATRLLLRAGETAASIENLVRANSDLQSFIAGQVIAGRGKPAKQMAKSLASLEDMVGRSANQLLVASAILDALGYQAPAPGALDASTGNDDDASSGDGPSQQTSTGLPRRPRRRQRF